MNRGESAAATTEFSVGDKVLVRWMGEQRLAEVERVETRGYHARRLLRPHYWLRVEGLEHSVSYYASEMERT